MDRDRPAAIGAACRRTFSDHSRRPGQCSDTVLPNELRPVRVQVRDDGQFAWEPTNGRTNFWMYDRGDPRRNEEALREALPALYESFRP